MFLFLIGMDVVAIGLLLVLSTLVGVALYYGVRVMYRRILKQASDRRIHLLSWVTAVLLSPVMLITVIALALYVVYPHQPEPGTDEYYEKFGEGIQADLQVGMTKSQVLDVLGESDTTQTVMTHDLFPGWKNGKYVLEITFEEGRLKTVRRK